MTSDAFRAAPPERSMLLMCPPYRAIEWLLRVLYRGECATHIGILFEGRVHHVTPKGYRCSRYESVRDSNFVLDVAPLPSSVSDAAIRDAIARVEHRSYNRPLFWYMFVRGWGRNWGIPTPVRFHDPAKVMCADLVSFAVEGVARSHEETPTKVFDRYRAPSVGTLHARPTAPVTSGDARGVDAVQEVA